MYITVDSDSGDELSSDEGSDEGSEEASCAEHPNYKPFKKVANALANAPFTLDMSSIFTLYPEESDPDGWMVAGAMTTDGDFVGIMVEAVCG